MPTIPLEDLLRLVIEEEASDLHLRSPRVSQDLSGKELQLLHDVEDGDSYGNHEIDDPYGLSRHGSSNSGAGVEGAAGEAEGDDSVDDDLMDKISSSPSIEDGGYHLPCHWPGRGDSLASFHTAQEDSQSAPPECEQSSSPFLSTPTHFPLFYPHEFHDNGPSMDHHRRGEYPRTRNGLLSAEDDMELESRDRLSPLLSDRPTEFIQGQIHSLEESYEGDFDSEDFRHLLLPADDPLLDNSFDDTDISPMSTESASSELGLASNAASRMGLASTDYDDDTGDVSFSDDDRFVDSGWGGECLREAEDIDFEFVYALHTFVATVEGQANAAKGETMVLLDDSNSYWWLVRVVKDGTIGNQPYSDVWHKSDTSRLPSCGTY